MRKPTLHDVAAAAGVSYATADRVLNARGNVSARAEAQVRAAIARLGYRRDVHAANLSRRRVYRFRFLLPSGDHGFFRSLRQSVLAEQAARAQDRVAVSLDAVPAFDGAALAGALARLTAESCDCVAFLGVDDPEVAAQVARLSDAGVAVLTVVSDIPSPARAAYVGIDNIGAGRTAGRLMALGHRGRAGRILPLIGTRAAQDHAQRLAGVAQVLDAAAGIALLPAVETRDDPARMRAAVAQALADAARPTGLYSAGAGNRGLVQAVAALDPAARPLVIVHELVPHSRAALEAGLIDAVIDQKPAEEVAAALDIMRALADGLPVPPAPGITPTIYVKDNLPAQPAPAPRGDDP
ncbi:substrate-binding domain-containing protein [Rhodobacteraceae bacterium 2CG4]|uniref:Substrate-binding domain-containing protein n=1 Tax=Halovulum marinum TaxID=2662447 RepID=A0A6L5YUT0_9RHOB|nr:LacI family DNA-binding transcriptional regulator [Halovulum marinum]MSU88038.1 substrate-binding domain-containing protein [Halovulum marinum]